jgi:uncharacterized membrane protein YgcG
MGLSVSIASAIAIVGWIAFIGATSTALITTMNNVGILVNSASSNDIKLNVQLSLAITSVESESINFTVQNMGSREIFFENETFGWNSVIVTYNSTNWQSYLIDNYTILAINPASSNTSSNFAGQQSIKPGEEALIEVDLPAGAPPILDQTSTSIGSVLNVVFASQYGVTAAQEILVSNYGPQTMTSSGGNGSGSSGSEASSGGYTIGGGGVG